MLIYAYMYIAAAADNHQAWARLAGGRAGGVLWEEINIDGTEDIYIYPI